MKTGTKINRMTILLAVSLVQMSIAALLLNNLTMDGWSVIHAEDSEGYLLGVRFFLGEDIPPASLPLLKYRLLSPVLPFVAALLARFMPVAYTFLVVNMLLWLLSVYLCYRCAETLLNERSAYYTALLFTTSLPLIVWGLPIMVDMAAFFFALLNCLLITRIPSDKRIPYLVLALTLSLAILTKPSLVALLIFFTLYAGFQKQYLKIVSVVSLTALLVGGMYLYLGLGIEDFLTYGYLRHRGLFYVMNALIFCFHWGIPLAVWGICGEKQHKVFYSTYFISTFGGYLTFVHNPRLLFIVFPAVLPLVVRGMELCAQKVAHHWHYKPENIVTALVCSYMLTSTLLAVLYLYSTRVLQYRSLESIKHLLG
jgi:4-amino-4-deoxy-L-arabinose transferase-like glycosyltransferase